MLEDIPDLPPWGPDPKPDSLTGLPRPWGTRPAEQRRTPGPPRYGVVRPLPDGHGPVLEDLWSSRRWVLASAVVAIGLGVAFVWAVHKEPTFPTEWGFWLWTAIVIALAVRASVVPTLEVGSDWLRMNKKHWVNTYDLVEITMTRPPGEEWKLIDRSGRKVQFSPTHLTENPDMWPLLRNGMHFSRVNGAKTNKRARLMM